MGVFRTGVFPDLQILGWEVIPVMVRSIPTDDTAPQHRRAEFAAVLTTVEMERMRQKGALLIDTRENAAYIGWTVGETARGGHIPGAVDFSALWLRYPEGEKGEDLRLQWLPRLLKRKHMDTAVDLILCDTNGRDAAEVACFLQKNSCSRLYYYDMGPWTQDPSLPLIRYPNYALLVPAFAVHALLQGTVPETFSPTDRPRLFEVSWGEAEETSYAAGHVPGAVHVNTDWFEPPESEWMLDCDENLEKLACRLGIRAEDCVIVTGQELAPVCRFAVILRYLGVRDVRVMNGGMLHWQANGYEMDTGATGPAPVLEFGMLVPGQPQWIMSIPQVQQRLGEPDFTLVDTRSWEEYTGQTTGYSYHRFAGRIPGSVFGYPGPDHSSSPCRYRNPDNTPGNREEVLGMWREAGIDLDTHLSFFCGGGWRAAEILWFARVFGLENTSLYSDGWCGWSNRGLPSESGEPEDA